MSLTRREKIALIALLPIVCAVSFIPQRTLDEWEIFLLLFYLFPLGIFLITDPERRKE